MSDRYILVRDRKITRDTYDTIDRYHPNYQATLEILATHDDLHATDGTTRFLRIPVDGVRMVYPHTGRPHLECDVWERDADGDLVIINAEPVLEPDPYIVWID